MSKRGVSLGRNTGAKLAKNERILFLDADVRLDTNFLQKASQLLDKKSLKVAGVYMNADHLKPWFTVGYLLFNMGIFFVSQFFLSPTAVGACIFFFPVNPCMSNWVGLMSLSPCVKIVTMSARVGRCKNSSRLDNSTKGLSSNSCQANATMHILHSF